MISVREKIDRIKIPAQVESLSVDDPNDDRHQSISTATTAVKREAIRVIIAAAIEDQASLDPEGSETFVRGRSGDEETGPSSKMRRIESENLPPSSGIRFIASDSTIDHLDEIYLDCVSSTTAMPSEFDTIWSFDDLRSRYKPDVSENDIYTHIDNSLILALEYLVDPKLGLLRKQVKRRRFERAKNTKSPDTNDGMTDFVGVGTSKDGSALRHPPLWEIKRKNVWSTVLFR